MNKKVVVRKMKLLAEIVEELALYTAFICAAIYSLLAWMFV